MCLHTFRKRAQAAVATKEAGRTTPLTQHGTCRMQHFMKNTAWMPQDASGCSTVCYQLRAKKIVLSREGTLSISRITVCREAYHVADVDSEVLMSNKKPCMFPRKILVVASPHQTQCGDPRHPLVTLWADMDIMCSGWSTPKHFATTRYATTISCPPFDQPIDRSTYRAESAIGRRKARRAGHKKEHEQIDGVVQKQSIAN
jgi:hypothetical protein